MRVASGLGVADKSALLPRRAADWPWEVGRSEATIHLKVKLDCPMR